MRHSRRLARVLALAALGVAVLAVGYVLLNGGESYSVTARFESASQLVRGNNVQVAGVAVGSVESIELADDGRAEVDLAITDPAYQPLREGTEAIIRVASLSGVANRYVDLRLPGGDVPDLPDGAVLATEDTTSAVDLDQLLSTFDPAARADLQGVVQGLGKQYTGRSEQLNRGLQYLNPAFAASSRLFEELTFDEPALNRFLVENSRLVTDIAARKDDLAGAVDELATFTGAVARERDSLADAIGQLPPFMRRANSTFVNLRATVDDLRPLIRESEPVADRLPRFLAELRPLARDARPTLRDLSRTIRDPGPDDDLIDLTRSNVPVEAIANGPVRRNGKERPGAFPATVDALETATPQFAYLRPYVVDLTGWFDDFGHSGIYDALGGKSRVGTYLNAFANVEGVLRPIAPVLRDDAFRRVTVRDQRNRCPGAAEQEAADGSNPWRPTAGFNCDPSQVLPGR